jgi:hypothetical protein
MGVVAHGWLGIIRVYGAIADGAREEVRVRILRFFPSSIDSQCSRPSSRATAITAMKTLILALALVAATAVNAQRAPVGPATRSYVTYDTSALALTNVRVIAIGNSIAVG